MRPPRRALRGWFTVHLNRQKLALISSTIIVVSFTGLDRLESDVAPHGRRDGPVTEDLSHKFRTRRVDF